MNGLRWGVWGLIAVFLTGCASWQALIGSHRLGENRSCAGGWLTQLQRVYDLPSADLLQDLKRRRAAVAAVPSAANRLRLALLLAFGGPRVRDDAEALELSRKAAAQARQRDIIILAHHVESVVRRRIAAGNERERLASEAGAEKARADALQEKLNALKAIEENLNRRTTGQGAGVLP